MMAIDKPFYQTVVRVAFFLGLFYYSLLAVIKEFLIGLKRKLLRRTLYDPSKLHNDLSGCVCLVIGAANGKIGQNIIKKLLRSQCYLIITLHGNDNYVHQTKINLFNNELKNVDKSLYRFERVDMMSFSSIIRLVRKLNNMNQKINFVIFNAGQFSNLLII